MKDALKPQNPKSSAQNGQRKESLSPPQPHQEKRWHFWAAIAALIIIPFILYWPSLHAPFIFDDIGYTIENPYIRHVQLPDFKRAKAGDDLAVLHTSRPLTFLTFHREKKNIFYRDLLLLRQLIDQIILLPLLSSRDALW